MIRVAVVDDEQGALERMSACLKRYSEENGVEFNVSCFSSSVDFLEKYNAGYDIVFMDIQLPDYDGIEVMRKLRKSDKSTILIYVTNMANLAIRCYEVDALDFIVKPVEYFSFSIKMNRALRRLECTREAEVRVKTDDGFVKLFTSSIRYVEVFGHVVVYHTDAGDFNTRGTLKDIEKSLKENGFARCNNCFLVNLRYVVRMVGNELFLRDEKQGIAISRTKKKEFMKALDDFIGSGK